MFDAPTGAVSISRPITRHGCSDRARRISRLKDFKYFLRRLAYMVNTLNLMSARHWMQLEQLQYLNPRRKLFRIKIVVPKPITKPTIDLCRYANPCPFVRASSHRILKARCEPEIGCRAVLKAELGLRFRRRILARSILMSSSYRTKHNRAFGDFL